MVKTMLITQQHLHQKPKDDARPAQPGHDRGEKRQKKPDRGVVRKQVAHSPKPAQEGHHGGHVEAGNIDSTSTGAKTKMPAMVVRVKRQVPTGGQVQMKCAREQGHHTQQKSDEKTDKIEGLPIHTVLLPFPWPLRGLPPAVRPLVLSYSGFKTCSSRSASWGVSKIAASSVRHFRVSSCLASSIRAWLNCGSRRKRSAPLISHRSSLSSSVLRFEVSSVWKPSGSSTRYPGCTLKNFASSMRVVLVRCGRAPLSICERYDWLMDRRISFWMAHTTSCCVISRSRPRSAPS